MVKEVIRVRLQTLARVFCGSKVTVRFGGKSATDGKTVMLTYFTNEIEPGVKATEAECLLALKALDAHECGHILFTQIDLMKKAHLISPLLAFLLNVIEDARIERCMVNLYEGTLPWLRFLNDYIFMNRAKWGEGPQALINGLISYAVVGRIPAPIEDQEEVMKLVGACTEYIDQGRLSEDTHGAYQMALRVWETIKDFMESFAPPAVDSKGTKDPRKAPAGGLDPRRKTKIAKRGDPADKSDSKGSEDEPVGSRGVGPNEDADEPNADEPCPDSPEDPTSDEETPREVPGEPEEPGGEKEQEDSPEGPESPEREPDDSPEHSKTEGKQEDSPEDPKEDPSREHPEEEPDGGPPEDTGEDFPDEESPGPEDFPDKEPGPEDTGEDIEEPSSEDFPDREPPEPEDFPDEEPEDIPEGSSDEESPRPEDSPDGESPEPKDFSDEEPTPEDSGGEAFPEDDFEGDISEELDVPEEHLEFDGDPSGPPDDIDLSDYEGLLDETTKELESIKEADAREEKSAPVETPDITEAEITAKLGTDIHRGVVFYLRDLPPDRPAYEERYRELKPFVSKATEEIRKALEYKASLTERNLRKGRLDSGALWKIRVNDNRVFCKTTQPDDIPTLAIYLLVDCSGSMVSGQNMKNARDAALLLYEVCAGLKIPVNVTGFTGELNGHNDVTHLRVVNFDAPQDAKYAIASLTAKIQNRDGYSIRVATRELALRPEKHKVLMVLSDGLPEMPYGGYHGKPGVIDTAKAVREAEKQNIGVIGLFFGSERLVDQAQRIYTNLIFVREVCVLPRMVGRTLKKIITGI